MIITNPHQAFLMY